MADKMNTDYWNQFYSGIVPQRGTGAWGSNQPTWAAPASIGSPYMTANERAQLEQQIAQSKAMQATMGKAPKTVMASGPAWNDPTELDLAAIDKWNCGMAGDTGSMLAMFPDSPVNPAVAAATSAGNPVTSVTGKMQPTSGGGGLAELLFGPSKNGMSGLAGLLGGPGAGGLLGMLGQGSAGPPSTGMDAAAIRKASGSANSSGLNKNGNWFDSSTGQWNYSDPKRQGFSGPKWSSGTSNGSLV